MDVTKALSDDYPSDAWLTPFDRDLPYEFQQDDDETAAELRQGEGDER